MIGLSSKEKGDNFERVVGDLLRRAGYELVPGPEIAGRETDWVAFSRSKGACPISLTFLVECKSRWNRARLGMDVVTDMENRVKAARRQGFVLHDGRSIHDPDVRGWIVTNTELTAKAGEYAKSQGIAFTSYEELLGLAVTGLEAYMTDLVFGFDVYRKRYVSPIGRAIGDLDGPQGQKQPLDSWLEAWVASEDDTGKPVLLVGDIGTGKTLCVKKLSATLAEWILEGSFWKIPVLIPLDEVSSGSTRGSCTDLVSEYLEEKGIAASQGLFPGDVASVVIADGLESVSPSHDRPVRIRGHLHGFGRLHGGRTKALVTCRTDLFEAFLAERSTYERFDVMVLSEFSQEMMKSYLTRCDVGPDEAWEVFRGCRLDGLAKIPVILEFLACHVENLPSLSEREDAGSEITRAEALWELVKFEIKNGLVHLGLDRGDNDTYRVVEAMAYDAWQRDSVRVSLDDLGSNAVLGGQRKVDIGRDAAWTLSESDSADILEIVAQETKILKQMGSDVAFTHPVFRDILVAGCLFDKLRRGGYIDPGTTVGSFVMELLRSL